MSQTVVIERSSTRPSTLAKRLSEHAVPAAHANAPPTTPSAAAVTPHESQWAAGESPVRKSTESKPRRRSSAAAAAMTVAVIETAHDTNAGASSGTIGKPSHPPNVTVPPPSTTVSRTAERAQTRPICAPRISTSETGRRTKSCAFFWMSARSWRERDGLCVTLPFICAVIEPCSCGAD